MSAASLSLICSCAYCASAVDPTHLRALIGPAGDATVLLTPGKRATCQLTAADRQTLATFLADGGASHDTALRTVEPPRGPVPKADRDD